MQDRQNFSVIKMLTEEEFKKLMDEMKEKLATAEDAVANEREDIFKIFSEALNRAQLSCDNSVTQVREFMKDTSDSMNKFMKNFMESDNEYRKNMYDINMKIMEETRNEAKSSFAHVLSWIQKMERRDRMLIIFLFFMVLFGSSTLPAIVNFIKSLMGIY